MSFLMFDSLSFKYIFFPDIFVVLMIDVQGHEEEIHKIQAKEMQELKKKGVEV